MCKTFLCFYAAISYEFLGRAAHLYSRNKVPLLHQALDSFLDCGAALPNLVPLPKLSRLPDSPEFSPYLTPPETPLHSNQYTPEDFLIWVDTPEQTSPERPSLIRSITQMIDFSLSNPDDDPFVSDSESEGATSFTLTLPKHRGSLKRAIDKENMNLSPPKTPRKSNDPSKKYRLTPSPLRIQKFGRTKACAVIYEDGDSDGEVQVSPRSKPLPLQPASASQLNIRTRTTSVTSVTPSLTDHDSSPPCKFSTPSSIYSRDPDGRQEDAVNITPARAAKMVRFNRGIELLREQISTNVTEIQQHVDQVKDIQRARRARQMQRATSFWSFEAINDEMDEEGIDEEEEQQQQKQGPEPSMDQFGNILYKETKQQRIVRLRADGWSTVGLRSSNSTWKGAWYYQEFCNMVLTELSLDN
jgi:hypothetical protein